MHWIVKQLQPVVGIVLSFTRTRLSDQDQKEPLMASSLSQAKSLCTATELTLVKASTRNEIGRYSVVQVRQKLDRARKLQDKWRDQSRSQGRASRLPSVPDRRTRTPAPPRRPSSSVKSSPGSKHN